MSFPVATEKADYHVKRQKEINMNTKLLMTASSILMGVLGIVYLFLPKEILLAFDQTPSFVLILFA